MKKIIVLILTTSQLVLSQNEIIQPMVDKGDRSQALKNLGAMAAKEHKATEGSKFASKIPYYWSEDMVKSSVMTAGPLQIITPEVIELSKLPEVKSWVEHSSRVEFDNTMKTLSANGQRIALIQAELGNGNLNFKSSKDIFQINEFDTPEKFKDITKILKQESDNIKKWPTESSFNSSTLANECQLDLTLKNGQKLSLFGTAPEIIQQLKSYESQGFAVEFEKGTLIRGNATKVKALYEMFNHKNGSVANFALTASKGDYQKFRKFNQSYNFAQKDAIKVPSKIGSYFKGGKVMGIGAVFGLVGASAIAGQDSESAEARLNSAPSKAAPKIEKSGTNN